MKFAYITLSILTIFTAYINKGPQNIALAITTIFAIATFFNNKAQILNILKKNIFFFVSLFAFFIVYNLSSFIHFGLDKELAYSFKRTRWAILTILFIPAFIVSLKEVMKVQNSLKLQKLLKLFFYLFTVLFSLIFIDSLLKLFFQTAFISELISSNSFKDRASWTFNPIPFSKLSFFGVLIMSFFYLKLRGVWERYIALSQALIMLITTVLTQTRAAWLGVFVAFLCFSIIQVLKKQTKLIPILLGTFITVLALLIISPTLNKRLTSTFTTKSFSNIYRIEHWKANAKLIYSNPLFGVGNNQNRKPSIMSPFLNEKPLNRYTKNEKRIFNHPHNEYLDIAAGSGILSLLLFLVCLFYPVYKLLKLSFLNKDELLPLLAFSYLGFYYFSIFFDKITYTNWVVLIACWTCALISKTDKQHDAT